MRYDACYKCGRALTSGDVDGLCLNCKTQIYVPALNTQIAILSAENANLKARVEAAEEALNAVYELLDARSDEFDAALTHDDYYTGGRIDTGERLKSARKRVLKASNDATKAQAKLEDLK